MADPTTIVRAARRYLNAPYHHQGRSLLGVDCTGLVVCTCRDLGMVVPDEVDYSRDPDGRTLVQYLSSTCSLVEGEMSPADILVFWLKRSGLPQHLGIRTDRGMIHSWATPGKVVEHGLTRGWLSRLHSVWRLP